MWFGIGANIEVREGVNIERALGSVFPILKEWRSYANREAAWSSRSRTLTPQFHQLPQDVEADLLSLSGGRMQSKPAQGHARGPGVQLLHEKYWRATCFQARSHAGLPTKSIAGWPKAMTREKKEQNKANVETPTLETSATIFLVTAFHYPDKRPGHSSSPHTPTMSILSSSLLHTTVSSLTLSCAYFRSFPPHSWLHPTGSINDTADAIWHVCTRGLYVQRASLEMASVWADQVFDSICNLIKKREQSAHAAYHWVRIFHASLDDRHHHLMDVLRLWKAQV